MNPDTNEFEELKSAIADAQREASERPSILDAMRGDLLRPDGTPVPKHWTIMQVGEEVVVKNYTFRVAYINEKTLVLEPVGVPVIGGEKP